jgi:hypothetical protein
MRLLIPLPTNNMAPILKTTKEDTHFKNGDQGGKLLD